MNVEEVSAIAQSGNGKVQPGSPGEKRAAGLTVEAGGNAFSLSRAGSASRPQSIASLILTVKRPTEESDRVVVLQSTWLTNTTVVECRRPGFLGTGVQPRPVLTHNGSASVIAGMREST